MLTRRRLLASFLMVAVCGYGHSQGLYDAEYGDKVDYEDKIEVEYNIEQPVELDKIEDEYIEQPVEVDKIEDEYIEQPVEVDKTEDENIQPPVEVTGSMFESNVGVQDIEGEKIFNNEPAQEPQVVYDYDQPQDTFYFGSSGDVCSTPDDKMGTCINIRRCEPLLELLKNLKNNPGAYSYLRGSLCDYEGLDPVVCCPLESTKPAPPKTTQNYYSLPGIEDNCGVNNGTLTRRVVNGVPAFLGEFPWIAALGYRSRRTPGKTNWQCGGTLITSRHVLTAAHCIFGHEDDIHVVRLGELDLERDDDGASPQDINIEKLIVHEEYSSVQHTNDIAIIRLANDASLNQLLWPICLPKTPEIRSYTFEKTLPFIAGWGSTSYKGPSSSKLLEAQIPVVSNTQCQEAYSRFKNQVVDQRVLCAGYAQGGKDACQGDSGGPLMWPHIPPGQDNIYYYLIGVVSFGYKCAEPGYPGVYTRVTEFIPWIENNLN